MISNTKIYFVNDELKKRFNSAEMEISVKSYQGGAVAKEEDKMSSCYVDGWNLIFCCSRKKPAHNQVVYQEENTQDVVLDKQFIG